MSYLKNVPLVYLYSTLIKRITIPILTIYYLLNQLTYSEIGIIVAVTAIVSLLTEIHGGMFADINGKRSSLALGAFFAVINALLMYIGDNFYYFLAAGIVFGFFGSLMSGSRESILYESLVQENKVKRFKKHYGRMLMISHFVNAIFLLLIPIIYTYNAKLPFLINIFLYTGAMIVALSMKEPPMEKHKKGFNHQLRESWKEVKANRVVVPLIFVVMIVSSFYWLSGEFVQPLMVISGVNVIYFGVIYMLKRFITGLATESVHHLEKYFKAKSMMWFGSAAVLVSLIGHAFGVGIWVVLATILFSFCYGFNRITMDDELNKNIKSQNRTTIISFEHLAINLCLTIAAFIFGLVADIKGLQETFGYATIVFVVCIALALIYYEKATSVSVPQKS